MAAPTLSPRRPVLRRRLTRPWRHDALSIHTSRRHSGGLAPWCGRSMPGTSGSCRRDLPAQHGYPAVRLCREPPGCSQGGAARPTQHHGRGWRHDRSPAQASPCRGCARGRERHTGYVGGECHPPRRTVRLGRYGAHCWLRLKGGVPQHMGRRPYGETARKGERSSSYETILPASPPIGKAKGPCVPASKTGLPGLFRNGSPLGGPRRTCGLAAPRFSLPAQSLVATQQPRRGQAHTTRVTRSGVQYYGCYDTDRRPILPPAPSRERYTQ
jgi:hypothetical protein